MISQQLLESKVKIQNDPNKQITTITESPEMELRIPRNS